MFWGYVLLTENLNDEQTHAVTLTNILISSTNSVFQETQIFITRKNIVLFNK